MDNLCRVKLTFMRPVLSAHDMSISFGIEPEKKQEFHVALVDFINFVNVQDGFIHKVEEVIDAETHKPCDLHITINGNQHLLANEFKNRMPTFVGLSKWQH